ncbi:MAG: undecaprenyl-diphosphate phosphatase [Dermatophilaceae bacterium]|nr:undecaprenyl-diphosphate phosphatase [Intrasporangiaceae bacterium]
MSWLEAIILGIVQGLTEFLPVSSSAHLLIVGQLFFDGRDPGAAFTAVSQIGTEMAVIVYFAKDIWRIISKWFLALAKKVPQSDPDVRMGWMVIVGSLPIAILGLTFEEQIDGGLRNLWITATMLAGVAVVLFIADRLAKNERTLDQLTWRHAIFFGLWQALALIPGVSRAGASISGGLLMGYRREAAARYSFLLAIPAVMSSGLYKLKDIGGDTDAAWGQTIVATVIAFFIGYAVIAWLLRYVATHTFTVFVVYRLMLAGFLVTLLATGTIAAI